MRAASIREPGAIEVDEAEVPAPGRGHVRLIIEGTGVCASNLGPWKGLPWIAYPMPPGEGGHEAWGRVDAVGDGVDPSWVGKRVAALTSRAFAEQDVAPASTLVELPASLEGRMFPAEAFACGVNIFRRSAIERGLTVAIVGVGFLGAILTRLCSEAGAAVIGISRRPFARRLAESMGATATVPLDDHRAVIDAVLGRTEGRGCDRVIECVGAQWPLDLAAELTRERGRLVIAGYHQDGPRQVNMQLWNWRGLDVVNAHERDPAVYVRGMREAIALVERGVLDPDVLITHRFSLDQLDHALDAAHLRPDGFVKGVVIP